MGRERQIQDMETMTYDDITRWLQKVRSDELGTDASACWASAAYMRVLCGKTQDESTTTEMNLETLPMGISHCFAENAYEIHYFAINKGQSGVQIYQTYDGIKKLQKYTIAMDDIRDLIRGAQEGSGKAWTLLFKIPKERNVPEYVGRTQFLIFP